MGAETLTHYNTKILVGQTDKRGHAWHYKASEQGSESNHYPGFIPVEDVRRRLFGFSAELYPIQVVIPLKPTDDLTLANGFDDDGHPVRRITVPGRMALTHSETDSVFNVFSDTYAAHQFDAWLLKGVSTILSDTLNITSAGLLKNDAVAWVEVSVPDTVITPEGVTFRPNLLACTSHDGSLATTFKRTVTNTVCDNTMGMALREISQTFKVRHTRHSANRLRDAAEALDVVQEVADDFAAEVKALCATPVTNKQWQAFLDSTSPISETKGKGQTMAIKKQDRLKELWNHDERVSPWAGTAWGVVQAVNTFEHHAKSVKTVTRAERNMLRTVTGEFDTLDSATIKWLNPILANV
jgi:phage/plasmid-like protein (TIGR03299 family)